MNSALQCRICMDSYENPDKRPYICRKCGYSLCRSCLKKLNLDQQKRKERKQKCPFCKVYIRNQWGQNRTLIELIEQQKQGLFCENHHRKIIALCSNRECPLDVGICSAPQCSANHFQRGNNNLLVESVSQPLNSQARKQQYINLLKRFTNRFKSILCSLTTMTQNEEQYNTSKIRQKLTNQAEQIVGFIKNKQLNQINSSHIAFLKQQLSDFSVPSTITLFKKQILIMKEKLQKQFIKNLQQLVLITNQEQYYAIEEDLQNEIINFTKNFIKEDDYIKNDVIFDTNRELPTTKIFYEKMVKLTQKQHKQHSPQYLILIIQLGDYNKYGIVINTSKINFQKTQQTIKAKDNYSFMFDFYKKQVHHARGDCDFQLVITKQKINIGKNGDNYGFEVINKVGLLNNLPENKIIKFDQYGFEVKVRLKNVRRLSAYTIGPQDEDYQQQTVESDQIENSHQNDLISRSV